MLTWPMAHRKSGFATSFAAMREHIASAHIHDNLGDKDAHLAPHDGSIDWPAALQTFPLAARRRDSADAGTKRKTGPDAPRLPDQITAAAKSLDRLEQDLQAL